MDTFSTVAIVVIVIFVGMLVYGALTSAPKQLAALGLFIALVACLAVIIWRPPIIQTLGDWGADIFHRAFH